jgi:hypothetical protein
MVVWIQQSEIQAGLAGETDGLSRAASTTHEHKQSSKRAQTWHRYRDMNKMFVPAEAAAKAAAVPNQRPVEVPAQVLDCLIVEDDTVVAHDAVVAVRVVGVKRNISVDLERDRPAQQYTHSSSVFVSTLLWPSVMVRFKCNIGVDLPTAAEAQHTQH